jgi:hypothetical protein
MFEVATSLTFFLKRAAEKPIEYLPKQSSEAMKPFFATDE